MKRATHLSAGLLVLTLAGNTTHAQVASQGHQSPEEVAVLASMDRYDDGHAYRERYWSPTVPVRGAIAIVWASYEFSIDGTTSHCGVDVFNFVKTEGSWHVANSMWTVEPNACAELRPTDPSIMRPAG